MIVGGIALAAVVVPSFLFSPSADVALIRGDNAPFKVKPKDSGGAKIAHQETTVMGMLGGVSASNEDVEILTPPAAVPEMPPAPVSETETVAVASEPAPPHKMTQHLHRKRLHPPCFKMHSQRLRRALQMKRLLT